MRSIVIQVDLITLIKYAEAGAIVGSHFASFAVLIAADLLAKTSLFF
jgi:hypothetical protein